MERRPIEARIDAGRESGRDPLSESFREAMSRWASGVTVVSVRDPDDGRVYATTATSFASVSADPPRVVVSFGPGAQVLPFLTEGSPFVVNVLAGNQQRLASLYADSFPVGPSPFPDTGEPVVGGALATLVCTAERIVDVGGSRLVLGRVEEAAAGEGEPLLYHRRGYRVLG